MKIVKTTSTKIVKTLTQREFMHLIGADPQEGAVITKSLSKTDYRCNPQCLFLEDSKDDVIEIILVNKVDEILTNESN